MKRRAAALLLGLALILTGCSSISEGWVTEKGHRDGYWYTTSICVSTGKTITCTPQMQYMPPSWWLDLRSNHVGEQETKTGFVYLNEATWETYEVGDYYPKGD